MTTAACLGNLFELVRAFCLCLAHASSSTFQSVLILREGVISLQLTCETYSHCSRIIFELFNDTAPKTAEK